MYPSDAMMLETAAQHLLDISSRVTASFFLFVSFLFLLYQLLLRQSNPTVCASSWKGSTVVPIRLLTSVCRAQINCCSGYRCRGLISWATYHCRHFHSQKGELKGENKTLWLPRSSLKCPQVSVCTADTIYCLELLYISMATSALFRKEDLIKMKFNQLKGI